MAEPISFQIQNTDAIVIDSPNVTIDLNGFSLVGPGQSAGSKGSAITHTPTCNACIIRNGIVGNWRGPGIQLPNNSLITNVVFYYIGDFAVVGMAGMVTDCKFAICSGGVWVGGWATVRGCNMNGCSTSIEASGYCRIENNLCSGSSYGIYLTGGRNVVIGNTISTSTKGIKADAANNLVIQNSATENSDSYGAIVVGNTVGPIVTSGTIAVNNNPHANYEF